MSSRHRLILIAALTLGISRIASAQMADSLLIPISPPDVPSVKRDAGAARRNLERDQQAERDLHRVISLDSHTLSGDEHQLHEVREAVAHESTQARTDALAREEEQATPREH